MAAASTTTTQESNSAASTVPSGTVGTTNAPQPPTKSPQVNSKVFSMSDLPQKSAVALNEGLYSALSREDHIIYLDLEQKFFKDQQRMKLSATTPQHALPPMQLTPAQTSLYLQLRSIVVREQENFRKNQWEEALATKERYFFIKPQVEAQFRKIVEIRKERVKKCSRYFQLESAYDMRTIKVTPGDPVLKHKQTLLQTVLLGLCCMLMFPRGDVSCSKILLHCKSHWTRITIPYLVTHGQNGDG